MNGSVHTHTPVLSVIDSRALVVRQVDYHRAQAGGDVDRRVTLGRFDVAAQHHSQWDARLFEQLEQSVPPSQQQVSSLSGRALLDQSGDSGWQLLLPGEAGQTVERWDARGSHWQTGHDQRLRPLWIVEQAGQDLPRVAERFTYALVAGCNLCGRLVRHDDEAGSRLIAGYSLTGDEARVVRRFLATIDLPDWPDEQAARDVLLEPGEGASSVFVHGPLAQKLEQTDALGHRQIFRHALNGELSELKVRLGDGVEQRVLGDIRYSAMAQVESQVAGNGVVSQWHYDPGNGHLLRFTARRQGRSVLQDFHYQHDPLGNVLRIEDHSQLVLHFSNQKVDPVSTFVYDSLCQLVEASGREAAGNLSGPQLPDLAPDPGDTSRLLNYRECYAYDRSGNLVSLTHSGSQAWTRRFNVATDSNRSLPEPGDPASSFDANGNLLDLGLGQRLHWGACNQLYRTSQVVRRQGENDEEHYRYGGDGLRLRKVVDRLVAGRMQRSETRYLPGLELHVRQGEAFAVVNVQGCRCLVWSEGQPDGIAGPQWRYNLGECHDSSALELDGEARIISHEGYYPFGGTAWWAGRSALEASYRMRRYSGRERDSTGLYDYGLRYYAPWLARWINPDPAADVDGLNRYRMVRNNPLTFRDEQGLQPVEKQETGHVDSDAARDERRQFVASQFKHKFPDQYMVGSSFKGPDGRDNEFVGVYGETSWSFDLLYKRSSADKRFHASDVLFIQACLAAERYGIDEANLASIEFENVVNSATLSRLSALPDSPGERTQGFLRETPLGRLAGRLLSEIGRQPGAVTVRPITNNRGAMVAANIQVAVEPVEQFVEPPPEPEATPQISVVADAADGVRVHALFIPSAQDAELEENVEPVARISHDLPPIRRSRY